MRRVGLLKSRQKQYSFSISAPENVPRYFAKKGKVIKSSLSTFDFEGNCRKWNHSLKIEQLWIVAYFDHVVEFLHELIRQELGEELALRGFVQTAIRLMQIAENARMRVGLFQKQFDQIFEWLWFPGKNYEKYGELAARGEGTEPSLSGFVEDGVGGPVLKTLDGRMSLF